MVPPELYLILARIAEEIAKQGITFKCYPGSQFWLHHPSLCDLGQTPQTLWAYVFSLCHRDDSP